MFDRRKVSSIPDPDERDLYRRWWLPGLTKKEEKSVRRQLTEVNGLTDRQVDRLLVEYAAVQMGVFPDSLPVSSESRERGRDWSTWAAKTVAIDVDLRRGGRVILREPNGLYRIELYFVEVPSSKAGERGFLFKRVELLPERVATLAGSSPDLRCYWAAFLVRTTKETSGPMLDGSVPLIGRPAPGKPFDMDWYMSLLDAETALKEQGHSAPAKELAERYGVKYATMRSYLSRGHKRLEE